MPILSTIGFVCVRIPTPGGPKDMIRMDDFLGGDLRIVWGDQIADCTIRSDEGAQACDGLSNNEGIHLSRALIRVDCLRVGDKAADMVVEQDTVAAEQFAGIADRFSAFDSAEQSEACSSCMRPSSCNCAKRSIIVCVDVTFPSIRTRRSCTSWNPPIGLPNCIRSVA